MSLCILAYITQYYYGCAGLMASMATLRAILSDKEYRREVCASIDPAELLWHADQSRVPIIFNSADEQLLKDINTLPRQEAVERILRNVEERGEEALKNLLWCLEETGSWHSGHKYALEILMNDVYDLEKLGDIVASIFLRNKLQELRTKKMMSDGIDVDAIVPYLRQAELLSVREMDNLQALQPNTRTRKFIKLKSILTSKGPLAYLKFTQVLINSVDENPHLYGDIFKCLFEN